MIFCVILFFIFVESKLFSYYLVSLLMLGFQVAVLDMSSMSILFFTDCISGHNSQIIAMTWTLNHSEIEIPEKPVEEVIVMLFKDTALGVIDGGTGKLITPPHHLKRKATAVSMYVIGKYHSHF